VPGSAAQLGSRCPHAAQYWCSAATAEPQAGQLRVSLVPHPAQNLAPSGLSKPQPEHRTDRLTHMTRLRGYFGIAARRLSTERE
jgi:hypothetical protein